MKLLSFISINTMLSFPKRLGYHASIDLTRASNLPYPRYIDFPVSCIPFYTSMEKAWIESMDI